MADAKISALPAATTPLADNEVFPLVQGGTTVKATVASVTAGRAVTAAALSLTVPLAPSSGGTGIGSAFTANGVVYASSTSALATGSALTFNGTNLATTGSATATAFIPTGSTVPANGMYRPAANTLAWSTNSAVRMAMGPTGSIGLGTTVSANYRFLNALPLTGSTIARGYGLDGVIQSDVTNIAIGFESGMSTVAASFALSGIRHFSASQGTIGAGSSATNQYGYYADSTMAGATNNFGFYGGIPAGTGRWNFNATGTANNAFAGPTRFGAVTVPLNTVDITGSLGRGAPVTKTADFTLAATENWLINNKAGSGCVVTLPAASAFPGREVMLKNLQAQTVTSVSSNVCPIDSATPGTAILPATAGAWCVLVSDASNWITMERGT